MFESTLQAQARAAKAAQSPRTLARQPEHDSYLACYEDLSSIYRDHRKRPRSSTYSPPDSDSASPASSTATSSGTADSLLSSSLAFSDLNASGRRALDSALLSPPSLSFNLLSASSVSLGAGTPATSGRPSSLASVSSAECDDSRASSSSSRSEQEAAAASGMSDEDEHEHNDDDDDDDDEAEAEGLEELDAMEHEDDEHFDRDCTRAARDEDERIFQNLILKERRYAAHNLAYISAVGAGAGGRLQRVWAEPSAPALRGAKRRSVLSWMLHVCVQEQCQDEIFALSAMILDKFLALHPTLLRARQGHLLAAAAATSATAETSHQRQQERRRRRAQRQLRKERLRWSPGPQHQQKQQRAGVCAASDGLQRGPNCAQEALVAAAYERELEQRQLVQFAACSLMLATKLRQTPRLTIRTLIEFSRLELPVALTHDDLTLGERFMLDLLKWDIAGLVTPNEFLHELLARKCERLLISLSAAAATATEANDDDDDDGEEEKEDNEQYEAYQTTKHQHHQHQQQHNNNHHHHHHQQQQQQVAAAADVQDDNRPGDERRHSRAVCRARQHPSHRRYLGQHHQRICCRHQHRYNQIATHQTHHHHYHHHNQHNKHHDHLPSGERTSHSSAKCKVNRVNRHTQILLELCMLDDHLSRLAPSTLAMAAMAVAIYGLSAADATSRRLDVIVEHIHESTDRVNKLDLMIDAAHQIEGYLQEEASKLAPFDNQ